jgi:hypothetical protein
MNLMDEKLSCSLAVTIAYIRSCDTFNWGEKLDYIDFKDIINGTAEGYDLITIFNIVYLDNNVFIQNFWREYVNITHNCKNYSDSFTITVESMYWMCVNYDLLINEGMFNDYNMGYIIANITSIGHKIIIDRMLDDNRGDRDNWHNVYK